MTITFTEIASAELSRRLSQYKKILQGTEVGEALEEKRAELNHRYLCLQTAIWVASKADEPAIIKSVEEVREELFRWKREMQRNSTVETMHRDGRDIAIILEFLKATAPVIPEPKQLTI